MSILNPSSRALSMLSGITAISTLVVFGLELNKSNIPQNLTTWVIWTVLNALLLQASISAGNKDSWRLSAGATAGVVLVTLILLAKGEWHVGLVEMICIIGVLVSTIVWKLQGPKRGVVAIVVAMTLAGLPNMYDTFLAPSSESWFLWGGLTLACILAALSAEKWTIEDRLYPVTLGIFNFIMLVLVFL